MNFATWKTLSYISPWAYKFLTEVWSPVLGENLTCLPEPENSHDKYVIKVLKNETVVGHVSREISRYCCYALNSGGKMKATVCGRRENKWGNGLEVPYSYLLKGPDILFWKSRVYYKRYCWKRKDRLMKSILLDEKCHSWKCLSLISPVGLYPGISPWAFMQGELICGGIGYICRN